MSAADLGPMPGYHQGDGVIIAHGLERVERPAVLHGWTKAGRPRVRRILQSGEFGPILTLDRDRLLRRDPDVRRAIR